MIYVDPPVDYGEYVTGYARRHGTRWSHCWTDGEPEELHTFAARLGLKRSYAQHEGKPTFHYDLTPAKRSQAVRMGARELSLREYHAGAR